MTGRRSSDRVLFRLMVGAVLALAGLCAVGSWYSIHLQRKFSRLMDDVRADMVESKRVRGYRL